MKSDLYITPYTNINSKFIGDINVRAKTRKLWKANIGINLCDLGLGVIF